MEVWRKLDASAHGPPPASCLVLLLIRSLHFFTRRCAMHRTQSKGFQGIRKGMHLTCSVSYQ